MPFGQVVVGPPGSGKTTYCHGMAQYLAAAGRKVALINLDPANDVLPYQPAVDVSDLVCLEEVMAELKLGPNGGMVYCMDYLQQNLDWLKEQLAPFEQEGCYFIFDCPGQVELSTMHGSFKQIIETLTGAWDYRLTAVSLVDAHLCTEPSKYISALLLSLSTMLHLELPHVNVLSKIDLIRQYGQLAFNLDFYTEVQDLSYLVRAMGNDPFAKRFRKLSAALCEVVEDFGLVSFTPLAIQDRESIKRVLGLVDKANGCVYASLGPQTPVPPEFVYGAAHRAADDDIWSSYQEMYVEGRGGALRQSQLPSVVERCVEQEEQETAAEQASSGGTPRDEGVGGMEKRSQGQLPSVVEWCVEQEEAQDAAGLLSSGGAVSAEGAGDGQQHLHNQLPSVEEPCTEEEEQDALEQASSSSAVSAEGAGGVRMQQHRQHQLPSIVELSPDGQSHDAEQASSSGADAVADSSGDVQQLLPGPAQAPQQQQQQQQQQQRRRQQQERPGGQQANAGGMLGSHGSVASSQQESQAEQHAANDS